MITAIDANVLLDIGQNSSWAQAAATSLQTCADDGAVVICDVALAEIVPTVSLAKEPAAWIAKLGIRFDPIEERTAVRAGLFQRAYVERSGGAGRRSIADFLIGAHALEQADRLLTRDRGFYRDYFRGLRLVEPK